MWKALHALLVVLVTVVSIWTADRINHAVAGPTVAFKAQITGEGR